MITERNLYRLSCDFGRMGRVEGIFTATKEDVRALQGRTIYFGEILGKHSQVALEIDEGAIQLIDKYGPFVEQAEQLLGHHIRDPWTPWDSYTISGYNPFGYVTEEELRDE